ncbi:hypothetical protein HNR23_004079 [Nocardiopsis mwathae]|uniref:DUF397 domain-containing protein n=1 Tax=Nocardiopsis mwathae TaxID=1472723 RepID=A0A7X0D8H4_9ACTN|nr:DUF397 domain-containing protein [Nocardiopsis mwathae]MBB6174019.1 hypothetical protein [Nocardiopsis mwathae]
MNPTPDSSDLVFRTSSYTDRSDCVEVADLPGGAAVRDSKDPEKGALAFDAVEWQAFLAGVKGREL